jgi:hypothetical protein
MLAADDNFRRLLLLLDDVTTQVPRVSTMHPFHFTG